MNCRRCRRSAVCKRSPVTALPTLEPIAPNAAIQIVISFANRFHERDNIEALLLLQINFQPARSLSLIYIPARSEIAVVRFVRPHSIRVGTGMNGLARR